MANIILKKDKNSKGIITFSHKELLFLESEHYVATTILEKLIKKGLLKVFQPYQRRQYQQWLNKLKRDYFIGIHWGWHKTNYKTPNWVDFHLASKGTLELVDDTPIIQFASTNFLPDCFSEPLVTDKLYDVATVCRDVNFKGLSDFVCATSELLNSGLIKNVLMIIPESLSQYGDDASFTLRQEINKKFSPNVLNQVHYLRLSAAGGYLGTNREFISNLMRQTKVFCLMSKKEGVAKVINEAQLCGANIVAFEKLIGGGLDYIDEKFFFSYRNVEEIPNSIVMGLNGPMRKDSDLADLRQKLLQKFTYSLFIEELGKALGYEFPDCQSERYLKDNLSRCLPNHHWSRDVTWIKESKGVYRGCDILSQSELKAFMNVALT